MGKEKTIQLILVIVIVALLLLNLTQFLMYSNKSTGVGQEDVPVEISEIKGDDWEDKVGQTVTVGGTYVENNGIPMLISDPGLLKIKRPMNSTEYIRLDLAVEQPSLYAEYNIKGKVLASTNATEKVYLEKHKYTLIKKPIVNEIPQYIIHYDIAPYIEHSGSKYAVLVSGGWTAQDSWPSFWNDLKLVYKVLVENYYYDPANIFVLYDAGVGKDSEIPVHYAATPANIDTVLIHLAQVMQSDDKLLFYATDHGGFYGTGGLEPGAADNPDEFIALWGMTGYYDDWLNTRLNAINFTKAIIILDLCFSGGFTWDCSRDNRIIMTASTELQSAFDHPDAPNGDFTYNLFAAFAQLSWVNADEDNNGMISVAEAFNFAAAVSISAQTPTYDDNGDGVPHYSNIPNGGMVEDEGRNGLTYL